MSTQRPFRFSALLGGSEHGTWGEKIWSRQSWLAAARHVEALGYTTLLLLDHMIINIPLIPALLAAAEATSLRVGSSVFNNDLRHPILLARDIAMLDLLTEGRAELGLGCGNMLENYTQLGIPFDPAGVRLSRFEEALLLIKRYFTEEEITFSGRYYQVAGVKGCGPQKAQTPHPPIYIGGGGKRVLSLAAREADYIGISAKASTRGPERTMNAYLDWSNATHEPTLQKLQWIREAAGPRFDQLEIGATLFIIIETDHREQVAAHMAPRFHLTAQQLLSCPHMLIGTIDQMVEELLRRRTLYHISSIIVSDPFFDTFAPVVARLAGR